MTDDPGGGVTFAALIADTLAEDMDRIRSLDTRARDIRQVSGAAAALVAGGAGLILGQHFEMPQAAKAVAGFAVMTLLVSLVFALAAAAPTSFRATSIETLETIVKPGAWETPEQSARRQVAVGQVATIRSVRLALVKKATWVTAAFQWQAIGIALVGLAFVLALFKT